jgi:hypothetical protein
MTNLKEITRQWLAEHGYSGLYDDFGCGCHIDDLFPCGNPSDQCVAGYAREPDEDEEEMFLFNWRVGPDKPEDDNGR